MFPSGLETNPVSRSTEHFRCPISQPATHSSRFVIKRVKKTGIEFFDPLSEESDKSIEITVSSFGRSPTSDDLLRHRAQSYRKGRFSVVRQKHPIPPIPEEPDEPEPDDLIKF